MLKDGELANVISVSIPVGFFQALQHPSSPDSRGL